MHEPEMIVTLLDRLVGRTLFETIKDPETGVVIVEEDEVISEDQARQVIEAGIEEATIRSVFMCNTQHGVCRECYERNIATVDDVEVGEAVDIIAAQSIGE